LFVAATGAVSVIAFAGALAMLVATVRETAASRAKCTRGACVVASGIVVATVVIGLISRRALTLSRLAFLVGLESMAIDLGRSTSLQLQAVQQSSWWPDVEPAFWRYVSGRRP
jgi:hypothetical protein